MDANSNPEFNDAFVVGEEELKKIHKLFSDRIGPVKISADCADKMTRSFNTLAELFAYENSTVKRIERLHLSARSSDYTKEASLNLPSSRYGRFTFEIRGREDVVSNLREKITDIIHGMIPWYSRLYRIDFVSVALISVFVLWFVAAMSLALKLVPAAEPAAESDRGRTDVFGIAFLIGLVVVAGGINRFRDYAFPRGVFLIGQGKNRYKFLVNIQWVVVIGFFVSLAAGIPLLLW